MVWNSQVIWNLCSLLLTNRDANVKEILRSWLVYKRLTFFFLAKSLSRKMWRNWYWLHIMINYLWNTWDLRKSSLSQMMSRVSNLSHLIMFGVILKAGKYRKQIKFVENFVILVLKLLFVVAVGLQIHLSNIYIYVWVWII